MLDTDIFLEALVLALGPEIARDFNAYYAGRKGSAEERAQARFADHLLCIGQNEHWLEADANTGGPDWQDAIDAVFTHLNREEAP